MVRERTMEWSNGALSDTGVARAGCAAGFRVLGRRGRSPLLVGACPLGVCVLDTGRPAQPLVEFVPFGKHRVTHVAFAGGHLYVTGEGHLWRLQVAPSYVVVNGTLMLSDEGAAGEALLLATPGGAEPKLVRTEERPYL